MKRGISSCAAGLLALAAFCLPARAEPSVIAFVSGPLSGAAAEEVKRDQDNNLAEGGTKVSESAVFRAGGLLAYVKWSRLGGYYAWQDSGLNGLTEDVRQVFDAAGATVVSGDYGEVNGFRAQYRDIRLTGSPRRCGVFELRRVKSRIIGFACRTEDQAVPILAILQGLSIDGVIGP
ncbi:hypothetical protein [Inquilinus limosus]|uniref:hypothetical protein n=1 Tax=Inquilinus limosus TaxID=171674 RepID=UPI0012DF3D24|nr:hypothetical protein [Inquilinus limosus]